MPVNRDRITVIETVYFQPLHEEAIASENRFWRELQTSGEEIYDRKNLKATEEWSRLVPENAWLERVSMLTVANMEGRYSPVLQSFEEKQAIAQRTLEITTDPAAEEPFCWLIPVGESFRGVPSDITKLYVRSQFGTCRYSLFLFPE